MCDPLVGGLIAGAASIASAGIQQSQNEALAEKQQAANDQWVAYQTKIRREQAAAEDQARSAANQAREDTLQKVSPQNQQQEQLSEQQRLNTQLNAPQGTTSDGTPIDPNTVGSSTLLSGQQTGNQQVQDSMTKQLNQATAQARGRIAALATAQSYGGSFGGLGNVVPQQFTQGGNYINMVNDIRQGNLKTYGVEQQVQPLTYTSTGGNMFGGLATALGGLAGKGISAGMTGGGWGS